MKIIVHGGFPVVKIVEDFEPTATVGDFLAHILPKWAHSPKDVFVLFQGKSLHLLDKQLELASIGMVDGSCVGVYDLDMLMTWMF